MADYPNRPLQAVAFIGQLEHLDKVRSGYQISQPKNLSAKVSVSSTRQQLPSYLSRMDSGGSFSSKGHSNHRRRQLWSSNDPHGCQWPDSSVPKYASEQLSNFAVDSSNYLIPGISSSSEMEMPLIFDRAPSDPIFGVENHVGRNGRVFDTRHLRTLSNPPPVNSESMVRSSSLWTGRDLNPRTSHAMNTRSDSTFSLPLEQSESMRNSPRTESFGDKWEAQTDSYQYSDASLNRVNGFSPSTWSGVSGNQSIWLSPQRGADIKSGNWGNGTAEN